MWEGKVPEVFVRNNVFSPSCVFCLLSFIELKKKKEEESFLSSLSLLSPRLLFSGPLRELGHWTESSLTS